MGDTSLNRAVSERRAQAVVDFLVDRYKLDRNRFVVKGNGPDKPVKPNTTDESRAANRRTDIAIVPLK